MLKNILILSVFIAPTFLMANDDTDYDNLANRYEAIAKAFKTSFREIGRVEQRRFFEKIPLEEFKLVFRIKAKRDKDGLLAFIEDFRKGIPKEEHYPKYDLVTTIYNNCIDNKDLEQFDNCVQNNAQ